MEQALVAMLLADTALASLVNGRIRWVRPLQNEVRPFVLLTKVSSIDDVTYTQVGEFTEARVQVDCYAETYAAVKSVAAAVKAAINGKSYSPKLHRIFHDGENDAFADSDSTDKLFRVSTDYRVFHR